MATIIKLLRGNTTQCNRYLAQPGEPFIDTEAGQLRIGDGATTGGAIVLDIVVGPEGLLYARTAKDPGRVILFEVPLDDVDRLGTAGPV
jgi:hypothetical protein